MPRKRNLKGLEKYEKKEAPDGGTSETSAVDEIIDGTNDNTSVDGSQANSTESAWDGESVPDVEDGTKGRHFSFVVYPSEDWVRKYVPSCKYDGRDGWGQAPENWIALLIQTGLAFVVSTLHFLDTYIDALTGEVVYKKPHWHVIVSWGNSTTYRSARALMEITQGPRPIVLRNVTGMYRYMNHRDNPEKFQYSELPTAYNGWERPVDSNEVVQIMRELTKLTFMENCQNYAELVIEAAALGPEYEQVATRNTVYFKNICQDMKFGAVRVLERYLNKARDLNDDERKFLTNRVRALKQEEAKKRRD